MRRSLQSMRVTTAVIGGALACLLTAPLAVADSFGSYGSSGGFSSSGGFASSGGYASSGGFGSSGGGFASSGGHASSGGSSGGTGPVRRLLGRIHTGLQRLHTRHHGSSGGSSGGFNGGSSGGYVSHASSGGSSGGYVVYSGSSGGSSGGSVGYGGATSYRPEIYFEGYLGEGVEVPATPGAAAPGGTAPGVAPAAEPTGDPQTRRRATLRDDFERSVGRTISVQDVSNRVRAVNANATGSAVLTMRVPQDAVVYVNDQRMKTPGIERRFVAKNLSFTRKNTYEIRVVTSQNGEEVSQTKVIDLVPEQPALLAFDFNREVAPVTSLTLRVPADAKVRLAGVDTQSGGDLRYFYTNTLAADQVWDDYQIEVQWEENGQTVVKRETVQLQAGQPLHFDFAADASPVYVAAR